MDFRVILSIILSMTALLIPCVATASDAVLSISPSGNATFTLKGTGFVDVAGMDVAIAYDTATLGHPKVVQGTLISGAMMPSNTKSPGIIRLAMVTTRAIAGSGLIATITFDKLGTGGGKILSLTARLVNSKGASLAVRTQVFNPFEVNSTPASGTGSSVGTTANEQADVSSQSTQISSGSAVTDGNSNHSGSNTINMAPETAASPSNNVTPENTPEQHSEVAGGGQKDEPVVEAEGNNRRMSVQKNASSLGTRHVVYKSVLDRFREFKGKRTPRSLAALFAGSNMAGIRQTPSVALADGKTTVKVQIQIPLADKKTPVFVLNGAQAISLSPEGGIWTVEVLPNKNVHKVGLTVLNNGSVTEIPLSVALPIEAVRGFPVTGNRLSLCLKERAGNKIPRFDLNGDGLRNYVDDYIFAANYIVRNTHHIR